MHKKRATWWRTILGAVGIAALVIALSMALGDRAEPTATGSAGTADDPQVLRMTATDYGYTPNEFQVTANRPVRLIIDGETRGCGSYFFAPKLGITTLLQPGDGNVFEFTPAPGTYEFSCSMGMFTGVIVAV